MKIAELFDRDVTRDIPPVVSFHQNAPEQLQSEVEEYIITGGYPDDSSGRRSSGIHEQYVRLLTALADEVRSPSGKETAAWISGFYGSGKSSFAKLLGYSLDGLELPDGRSLAEALLARDTSPRSAELREGWQRLREQIDPVAVVFDIGGFGRDDEHVHAACLRAVQRRLGYSSDAVVASYELALQRDEVWDEFLTAAEDALARPWADARHEALADDHFSLAMHQFQPGRYTDPGAWMVENAGTEPEDAASPREVTLAIADMFAYTYPGEHKTLFLVVDEVSQYIHQDEQRMLRLQSFATELGGQLRGQAWLLALGQQKLEEADATQVLGKLKDRFPPKLRVHLEASNIRDVVHRRLLRKKPEHALRLRELFQKHRNDLKLFGYECEQITEDDFVEVYPLLPGHIDLLLQITTALRQRSARSQGDDQSIRGLLQLLGELFRAQQLAEQPVGDLITLDQIYEVQGSALDHDTQNTMVRIVEHCAQQGLELAARAAKAVALLELIQETTPTTVDLVARCLFPALDAGPQVDAAREALEALRRENLLGYSERTGYKIQSSSAQEWESERRAIPVARDLWLEQVADWFRNTLADLPKPELDGRSYPWRGEFFTHLAGEERIVRESRDPAHLAVDFVLATQKESGAEEWLQRSRDRQNAVLWTSDSNALVTEQARELCRSSSMILRYRARRESISPNQRVLLAQEETRADDLMLELGKKIEDAWMGGSLCFRGVRSEPRDVGATFGVALQTTGAQKLDDLFPRRVPHNPKPAEIDKLCEKEISAPPRLFLEDGLGILRAEEGRFVAVCDGEAPRRVLEAIERAPGTSGQLLFDQFGSPPYGYPKGVVQACAAGLLHGSRVRAQASAGHTITAPRDAGARELLTGDREFRRTSWFPAKEDGLGAKDRNQICALFAKRLGEKVDRTDSAIADAVGGNFPAVAQRLRTVQQVRADLTGALRDLPDLGTAADSVAATLPPAADKLDALYVALEAALRDLRRTEPTVLAVHQHFDALNDGLERLVQYEAELTEDAGSVLRAASRVLCHQGAQLHEGTVLDLPGSGTDDAQTGLEAARRLFEHLTSVKPWAEPLHLLEEESAAINRGYRTLRAALLERCGERLDHAKRELKRRSGFATLTAQQAERVLEPLLAAAPASSDPEAIAPTLTTLETSFGKTLRRASAAAHRTLDEVLAEGPEPTTVRTVRLHLHQREIADTDALDHLLGDLREQIAAELDDGHRVRLLTRGKE